MLFNLNMNSGKMLVKKECKLLLLLSLKIGILNYFLLSSKKRILIIYFLLSSNKKI